MIKEYWSLDSSNILSELDSSATVGLNQFQIDEKQKIFGKNMIVEHSETSLVTILFNQLKSIIVVLLILIAIISVFLGQKIEAASILAVIIINTFIGFFTELKAVRSIEALSKLGVSKSTVLRDGKHIIIDSHELVPGDIVILDAGDIVNADLRIIEASKMTSNESILTGESLPVSKTNEIVQANAQIYERSNCLFKGTFITRGSGRGIVVHTGKNTEVGKIAELTQITDSDELTPLEKRLEKLGKQLLVLSFFIGCLVILFGYFSGKSFGLMLETAIALAIATIPEGLTIVSTLALAKGIWILSKNKALVNKLSAIETLGATSVIFSDKTGTLTENQMTVGEILTPNQDYRFLGSSLPPIEKDLQKILEVITLCSNASINKEHKIGDPMEIALLEISKEYSIKQTQLQKTHPELQEVAFDSQTLMMATYNKYQDSIRLSVKGAPEKVIEASSQFEANSEVKSFSNSKKNEWLKKIDYMGESGFRVLAVAYKDNPKDFNSTYHELVFLGLIGLIDPARKDVKISIQKCHQAGIKVIMVTGDNAATAGKIAKDITLDESQQYISMKGSEIGEIDSYNEEKRQHLLKTSIFSRVTPEQKLNLINYYQDNGFVVAMTGDGVNDAPALKSADIGVAMGKRGTQVAQEAADIVLQDDRFETIITAIKQGRIIYLNIKRFIIYLLSCNISEVFIIAITALMNIPIPLLPLQILFLNLVTDVFPALALGVGEGDDSYLSNKPRHKTSPLINNYDWGIIFLYGSIITVIVLGFYIYTLNFTNLPQDISKTMAFLILGFAQIFHVFNMKKPKTSILKNDITKNKYVWYATIICTLLLIASTQIPYIAQSLKLSALNLDHWKMVIGLSLLPYLIGQLLGKYNLGVQK